MMNEALIAHPRASNVIERRLIEGRDRAPGIALMILSNTAGPNALRHLKKIADAREAPDLVRLEAQRLHGWGLDDADERASFVATLTDPESALAQLAATAGYGWPDRPFILAEVLAFLRVMTPDQRLAILTRAVENDGPAAIPLLHSLVHDSDSATQIAAIEALERFRFAGSVGPLTRLARTATTADVRERAEAALGAGVFTSREVPFDDEEMTPFPPDDVGMPTQAMLSTVSGIGEQSMFVFREMTDEITIGIAFFMDDRTGFQEAYSLLPNTFEMVQQEMEILVDAESALVPVSPAVARGAFALTLELMAANGLSVSPEIEVWEPFLHDSYPPADDEPIELPVIDDTGYAGRHDLVARGQELNEDTEYFYGWLFDDALSEELAQRDDLPPADAWTDEHYRTMLNVLVTPDLLAKLPGRLCRQAYLLGQDGLIEMQDVALAVAASLRDASIDDLASNPFLRSMALLSVDSFRNTFGRVPGAGDDLDMDDFDPDMFAEAMETLGITPEELLRSMGMSEDDLPRGRR